MRNAVTLVLWTAMSLYLPNSSSAAEDWYHQEEGSSSSSDDQDSNEQDSNEQDSNEQDSNEQSSNEQDSNEQDSDAVATEGWGLGLRVAYAAPFGDAAAHGALSDLIKGAVKPQVDIRYGLDAHLALGAYLAFGGGLEPAPQKRACDMEGVDCRLLMLESGLLAEYRILPRSLVDPWVGANVGVEWLSQSLKASEAKVSLALLGVGFGASAGADFELGRWAIGPFLGLQIGRFMRSKAKVSGSVFDQEGNLDVDGKIQARAYHYWLNVGLRVRYP